MWDSEEIPPIDQYIDRTFGSAGYLAQRWGSSYQPREGQVALAHAVDRAIGARTHLLSEAPTGCHAAGQLILMFDGSTKLVEDVVVGDKLMGPDGESRAVLGLARGTDWMVDVVPENPDWTPWRVNRGHILTLIDANLLLVDVSVRDWPRWPSSRRSESRLIRLISGVPWASPFKLSATGTVEPYYGFTLDGDGRFLLDDGTVTHNTGKSLAYSVPATYHAAMRKQTVVLVTANIALQEQLVNSDLPLLAEVLPWAFSFGLLKGRSNYLCQLQYERARPGSEQQGALFSADALGETRAERDRTRLLAWAEHEVQTGGYGDSSALAWKPMDKLWRELSVASEDCHGSKCSHARVCGALAAQRRAREAQVIVTNYHLFFLNLLMYMERGTDILLPAFDVAVFDEAHAAASVARDFFGWKISEPTARRAARHFRGTDPLLAQDVEHAAGFFFEQMLRLRHDRDRYKARIVRDKLSAHDVEAAEGLLGKLTTCAARLTEELGFAETATQVATIEIAQKKVHKLGSAVQGILDDADDNLVYFVEEDEFRKAHVACRLVRPARVLRDALFGKTVVTDGTTDPQPVSIVCTSATLATESNFEFVREELGVVRAEEIVVNSPFDFARQALFIIPDVCEPNDPRFTSEVGAVLLRTIVLARGRTLGLFTSRKRMNEVHDSIKGKTPYRILSQDDGQRAQLIAEFKRDTHACLLGVASFWAGVDVPGESLSCVFIDKLPFPTPDDPVLDKLTEANKRAWAGYAVPRAIIELKQGFGRLIRTATDRGVVVCCDTRLITKGYGKQFLRAMPRGMQKVRNLEAISEWLDGPAAQAAEVVDPFS